MLWVVMMATTASADSTLQRKFMWEEANLKMSNARNEPEFLAAADAYLKLVETGARNSPLFYNLGTAFLLAGQREEATKYLTRAERYSGSNWEIRHNMLIALAGKEKDESVSLPWYRVPLFWHYGLAGSVRMTVAVCAFVVMWLALALNALGFKRLARPVIVISLVLVIMFGSSVATSLHQESSANSIPILRTHGKSVNMSPVTVGKSVESDRIRQGSDR